MNTPLDPLAQAHEIIAELRAERDAALTNAALAELDTESAKQFARTADARRNRMLDRLIELQARVRELEAQKGQ